MELKWTVGWGTNRHIEITPILSTNNPIFTRYDEKLQCDQDHNDHIWNSSVEHTCLDIYVVNLVNKWKMKERVNITQTRSSKYVHYSEIDHIMGSFMTYTEEIQLFYFLTLKYVQSCCVNVVLL